MSEQLNNDTVLDEGALTVLLQELSTDLPEDVTGLLDNKYLNEEILKYLDGISSIESKDYLSSVPPTPSADGVLVDERTLIHDIAELDATQRSIDTTLKNLIVKSHNAIIDNKVTLDKATDLFQNEFNSTLKSIWRTFNEDNLNDYGEGEDPDLHELEADLEEDNNKNSFRSTVAKIKQDEDRDKEQNKNLSIVLENMDQILSILELPSLTGACIKAGYYSEALEISSYTRRLAIRFPNNDLIKEVEGGIKNEMSYMLTGLIRLLRTNLKQSSLIKTLSYLKRIPPFSQSNDSEGQLKIILLHARYQFIKSELDSLIPLKESELWEKYLKRSIEVIREHCFGSIMTYKNVFPDIDDSETDTVVINLEPVEEPVVEVKDEESEDQLKVEVGVVSSVTEGNATETKTVEETKNNEREETKAGVEVEALSKLTLEDKVDGEDHEEETTENTDNDNNKPEDIKEVKEGETKPEREGHIKQETKKENEKEEGKEEIKEGGKEEIKEVPKESDEQRIFGKLSSDRAKSNILLFEFVQHIIALIIPTLRSSFTNIPQLSIRDGLYLQLIYCAKSLARIDENFGDLMISLLLNAKLSENVNSNEFLIDRESWITAIEKQKKLAISLNRSTI